LTRFAGATMYAYVIVTMPFAASSFRPCGKEPVSVQTTYGFDPDETNATRVLTPTRRSQLVRGGSRSSPRRE
jgi:hypothetical protein